MFPFINDNKIVKFIKECEKNGWDLDSDYLIQILKLNFTYTRDSNTIAESYDSVDEFIAAKVK